MSDKNRIGNQTGVPLESDETKEAEVLAGLRSSVEVLVSEKELLAPTDADAGWNLQD